MSLLAGGGPVGSSADPDSDSQARAFPFAGRVVVDVGDFDLPQYHQQIELSPEDAERLGEHIRRLGLEAQLRAAGWRLAGDIEGAAAGDWTPPDDRGNPWSFAEAVDEIRRRR